MRQGRDGFAIVVLTGCLALVGACAGLDDAAPSSEHTATAVSSSLVQSCPGYGSCASWSSWAQLGSTYCTTSNQCGSICQPVSNPPDYCATEIQLTEPDCCQDVPDNQTSVMLQRYQWCWNFQGDMCEQIDQQQGFVACGC